MLTIGGSLLMVVDRAPHRSLDFMQLGWLSVMQNTPPGLIPPVDDGSEPAMPTLTEAALSPPM